MKVPLKNVEWDSDCFNVHWNKASMLEKASYMAEGRRIMIMLKAGADLLVPAYTVEIQGIMDQLYYWERLQSVEIKMLLLEFDAIIDELFEIAEELTDLRLI